MKNKTLYTALTYFIALVWLTNGLFCKVLNLVPRHEKIVAQILGTTHSRLLTVLIGFSEIVMSIWIMSGYKKKLNAITQIITVAAMNILEYLLVPDLLLWGKLNSVFALIFMLIVYYNHFHLNIFSSH
jgi:uncharacterized membrane protein YphA (DoxX/SURF4 family)